MKLLNWKEKLLFVLLILFLLTLAITLTINAAFLYKLEVVYLGISEWVGLSEKALLSNYAQLMGYLNNPFQTELVMSDFPVSVSGAFHFFEVKRLFWLNYAVCLLTLIPSIYFVKNLWQTRRLWIIRTSLGFVALAPVAIGFFMLVAFEQVFILFHHLLFNNDAWLFDPVTDPVINALPETYFFHCFALVIIIFELLLFLLMWLGKKQLKSEDLL